MKCESLNGPAQAKLRKSEIESARFSSASFPFVIPPFRGASTEVTAVPTAPTGIGPKDEYKPGDVHAS